MKKYWKIAVPVLIGFAALTFHFLPLKPSFITPAFIFDMRSVLGKTLTEKEIPEYTSVLGPFVKKSKPGSFGDIKGELLAYDFKNGRIETIDGMIFGVWYLFKSSFATINGFNPAKSPITGREAILKVFGFPPKNKNFLSNNRAYVWEDQFNIRQLQLYREPAGQDTIVSILAYLVIPWEGSETFHPKKPEKHEQQEQKGKMPDKMTL